MSWAAEGIGMIPLSKIAQAAVTEVGVFFIDDCLLEVCGGNPYRWHESLQKVTSYIKEGITLTPTLCR